VVCPLIGLDHVQPRCYLHILIIGQIERINFEKGPTKASGKVPPGGVFDVIGQEVYD
jgi:hypothetical protein